MTIPSRSPEGSARPRQAGTQAVILAGGLGTRMWPVTETIAKPMIAVAGKPFLQHQLELLCRAGIERALLLVAYLGEQIRQYFQDGRGVGCAVSYSFEPSPLGTGGALKNAEAQLQDYFVLVNGDTYLAIDYRALLREFMESNCAALIVAYQKPATVSPAIPANQVPNNLAVAPDGLVMAYRKRNPQGLSHIDAGVMVLKKEILAELPAGRKCSLEEEIYPRLIARREMRAWLTSEPFYDMGSLEGLAALEEKLA
jgi:D-glycero-alpha-D-manno-heptose 1-phosphate guanylyltransferase